MNPKLQSSFIPRKPVVSSDVRKSRGVNLTFLLGLIIFILAAGASAGVFFWKSILDAEIRQGKISLARVEDKFDPLLIERLIRLDARLQAAQIILGEHLSASKTFKFIEDLTLESVRFSTFNMNLGNETAEISMRGTASGFEAVALQADEFGKDRNVRNTILSGLTLGTDGSVSFNFNAVINKNALRYQGGGAPKENSGVKKEGDEESDLKKGGLTN